MALENLEEYKYLTHSLIIAENEAKILNIERKYNDQKRLKEIQRLKTARKVHAFISISSVLGILSIINTSLN